MKFPIGISLKCGDEFMKRYIRSSKQSRWEREFEVTRSNITPKAFWNVVVKALQTHGESMDDWIPSYDGWANPSVPSKHKVYQNDNFTEVSKNEPYQFQLYYSTDFNVIMEFDFYDETKGYGYFYFASNQ